MCVGNSMAQALKVDLNAVIKDIMNFILMLYGKLKTIIW